MSQVISPEKNVQLNSAVYIYRPILEKKSSFDNVLCLVLRENFRNFTVCDTVAQTLWDTVTESLSVENSGAVS